MPIVVLLLVLVTILVVMVPRERQRRASGEQGERSLITTMTYALFAFIGLAFLIAAVVFVLSAITGSPSR
jgi:hypothetical protein